MKQICVDILNLLGNDEIDQIARQCGFVERTSPITGSAFLAVTAVAGQGAQGATLSELVAFLRASFGVCVTPQALDARFNDEATSFLETCLAKALSRLRDAPHHVGALPGFSHVYVIDSTSFCLPPGLAEIFPECKGVSSTAKLRIQFVLDFCTGAMFLEIGDKNLDDVSTLANIVDNYKIPMDGECLFLADLGYYKSSTLATMAMQPGLHFISKLHPSASPMKVDGTPLDLDRMLKLNPDKFEEMVVIGGALCRLVGVRIDDYLAGQKIAKASGLTEAQSGVISERYRRFLHYQIFITDLRENFTMERLFTLYRIRWQVELVFKSWKSVLGINRRTSSKKARILCEIYGRLIAAALVTMLECMARAKKPCYISSPFKAAKAFGTLSLALARAMSIGRKATLLLICECVEMLLKLCKKSTGKTKPTIEQRLESQFPRDFWNEKTFKYA